MKNFKTDKNTYILRLNKGDEIIESLKNFCETQNIKGGIISGIGFADNILLGVFDGDNGYFKREFADGHEITSLLGNVSVDNKEVIIHLHGTFSNKDFTVVGGHFLSARVALTCEIFIQEVTQIDKKLLANTNFKLWKLD